jgi:integrase
MPRPRPPHLHRERTRHGVLVWYVRRKHGPRTRLRAEYGASEFWAEYRAALEGAPPSKDKAKPHTFAWALERYKTNSAWTGLAAATRRQRENIFRAVKKTAGSVLLRHIDQTAIREGRERRADHPHAANNFLKTMRSFYAWAVSEGLVESDPTIGVKLLKGENEEIGFHTWTEEELTRYEERWPLGTSQRLAYDFLLYTGLRRGDAVRVGRQHMRDGIISIRTEKTGEEVYLPILPPLAESLHATKTGDLTFLVTEAGQPWVKESFGNWFRAACRAAGCPGSAHGLRKAGAARAAEQGATERQLMALFGWSTGKMASHYTRAADRKKLAQEAARMLLRAQAENAKRPHLGSGAGQKPKTRGWRGA